MNIEAAFSKLVPATWSAVLPMSPLERARHFVVPLEEDIANVSLAKTLVREVVAGRQNAAGVRWKYSGTNEEKAACFDLAASFYHGCFHAMADILQAEDSDVTMMWPCVEFGALSECHATCTSLRKKHLHRKSTAVRTFYPPWHFGCEAYVSDSKQKPSGNFDLTIQPEKMQYFHNPIDVLVEQGLLQDFPGISFGPHAASVCALAQSFTELGSHK